VPKQQLQLLGVTCLFIAAKVEEIYPPKLSEFAYVTDGACQEAEIIEKELIVVK
ncbi:Cyclin N-terminal, partial [Trinorchestia longiramus]